MVESSPSRFSAAIGVGPSVVLGFALLAAAMSRTGISDAAFPVGVFFLALAAFWLVQYGRSFIVVGPETLTIREYGFRSTTVRFRELTSATGGPDPWTRTFAYTLTDSNGRKVKVHTPGWQRQEAVLTAISQALIQCHVPMDAHTSAMATRLTHGGTP